MSSKPFKNESDVVKIDNVTFENFFEDQDAIDSRLPYVFDLYYDLKYMSDLTLYVKKLEHDLSAIKDLIAENKLEIK